MKILTMIYSNKNEIRNIEVRLGDKFRETFVDGTASLNILILKLCDYMVISLESTRIWRKQAHRC